MAVSLGAVLQAMAVAPCEVARERRRRLEDYDPRRQKRKVQGFGVHLWEVDLREKSLEDPILVVDTVPVDVVLLDTVLLDTVPVGTAPCPMLPTEHPVDLPTGHLERTHHHSPHHHSHQFAMHLHPARIGHILHSYLDPRGWALYVSMDDRDGQAERSGGSITRHATYLNCLPHLPLQGPVPVVSLSPSLVAA